MWNTVSAIEIGESQLFETIIDVLLLFFAWRVLAPYAQTSKMLLRLLDDKKLLTIATLNPIDDQLSTFSEKKWVELVRIIVNASNLMACR